MSINDNNSPCNGSNAFDKALILEMFSKAGLDIPSFIQEAFLGYKYRKQNDHLYEQSATIPTQLIKFYYSLNPGEIEFDTMKKNFIKKYVKNESQIEGVDTSDKHSREEVLGLADMYEYLHSDECEKYFSVYTLKDLHRQLFSHAAFPEYGGTYRNQDVYLIGSKVGLCDYSMIQTELYKLSPRIDWLHDYSKEVKASGDVDKMLDYLDQVVELKCALIKIHPFGDGNGRTVRAFINKLLEDGGLPPIYIKANERTEYHQAMNKANGEDADFSDIKAFYRYKICDSILELDINDRLRKEHQEVIEKEKAKQKLKR